MSFDTPLEPTPPPRPKRAPKRPTVQALLKAATAAGLKVAAIETNASGVKLIFADGAQKSPEDDGDALDRRMVEQMGVARMGVRVRR